MPQPLTITRQLTGAAPLRPVRPIRRPSALEQRIENLSKEADELWTMADTAERAGRGLDAGRLQRAHDQIAQVIASLRILNERVKADAQAVRS